MSWFPEKNDPELERLGAIVFDLRRKLFLHTEYRSSSPGEWETEEQEKRREQQNEEHLREWDNETLQVIRGIKKDFS